MNRRASGCPTTSVVTLVVGSTDFVHLRINRGFDTAFVAAFTVRIDYHPHLSYIAVVQNKFVQPAHFH